MDELRGARILITGATSQVGLPIARALAVHNAVFGLGRLRKPRDRERLEDIGVQPLQADLATADFAAVPDDLDYLLHFAVLKGGPADFDRDLAVNAQGLGHLLSRCRSVRAFLHCSSTAVYEPAGHHRLVESDPLGDNHRVLMPTYSISKIAAEAMSRFAAREWGIPTTIARLCVPYGDNGGWPAFHLDFMRAGQPIAIHPERPNLFNPIHEDDQLAMLPRLLDAASVPATIVNWGGSEAVSIEEWCEFLAGEVGVEARFAETQRTIRSVCIDPTRMHEIAGPTRVPWREGMRRMLEARPARP